MPTVDLKHEQVDVAPHDGVLPVVAPLPKSQPKSKVTKDIKNRLKLIEREMNKPRVSCQSKKVRQHQQDEPGEHNSFQGVKSIKFDFDYASHVDATLDLMWLSNYVDWTALVCIDIAHSSVHSEFKGCLLPANSKNLPKTYPVQDLCNPSGTEPHCGVAQSKSVSVKLSCVNKPISFMAYLYVR